MNRLPLCLGFVLTFASLGYGQRTDVETLQGTWEITALIDDGALVPEDLLKERYARDARFTVSGQTISFLKPNSLEKRTLLFVTDERMSPKNFDLAGAEKTYGKGIYVLSGDVLMLCLADADSKQRPGEFSAKRGEPHLLFTLKRVKAIDKIPTSPEPKANVPAPAPKETAELKRAESKSDEAIRKDLLGTWGHQSDDWLTMFTLNADGTFSSKKSYKKRLGKFFNEDVTSSGTWKLEDGVTLCKITASTDRELRNQIFSYRIRTITPTELIAVDQFGGLRREWKSR